MADYLDVYTIIADGKDAGELYRNGQMILDVARALPHQAHYWLGQLPGKSVLVGGVPARRRRYSDEAEPAGLVVEPTGATTGPFALPGTDQLLATGSLGDGRYLTVGFAAYIGGRKTEYNVYDVPAGGMTWAYSIDPLMLAPDGAVATIHERKLTLNSQWGERLFSHQLAANETPIGFTRTHLVTVREPPAAFGGRSDVPSSSLIIYPLIGGLEKIIAKDPATVQITPTAVLWQDGDGIHIFRGGASRLLVPASRVAGYTLIGAQDSILGLGPILTLVGPGQSQQYMIIQGRTTTKVGSRPLVKENVGRHYANVATRLLQNVLPSALLRYLARAL